MSNVSMRTQQLSLVHDISQALARDEFELFYQPICQLHDGRMVGFEALIRRYQPAGGVISPMDFLGPAEADIIRELGLWTLDRACRDWPILRQFTYGDTPFVSVKLAAAQFTTVSLVDDIQLIVGRHAMTPSELKFGLTETVIFEDPSLSMLISRGLVEMGSGLTLDDYGAGNASLESLQRYPIATLKLDRTFVAPILNTEQNHERVRSSVELAHSLGMNVIAQGIETKDVLDALIRLGCDYGQGSHFGEPRPLEWIKNAAYPGNWTLIARQDGQ